MAVLAYTTPLEAQAIDGEVVLTAPRGAASISLTPDAALGTAQRLTEAARAARDQGTSEDGAGDPGEA
jgi:hypothetical protein